MGARPGGEPDGRVQHREGGPAASPRGAREHRERRLLGRHARAGLRRALRRLEGGARQLHALERARVREPRAARQLPRAGGDHVPVREELHPAPRLRAVAGRVLLAARAAPDVEARGDGQDDRVPRLGRGADDHGGDAGRGLGDARLGGRPSNHGGCGERSGGCERRARSSLLRRAFRHAASVVAALAALAPRLVLVAHPDYSEGLLAMAIRITRVYTRRGDQGETDLVGGRRVAKDSPRIEAYGTVDELNAAVGVARAVNAAEHRRARAGRELDAILRKLQSELFDLGGELATPAAEFRPGMFRVGAAEVKALETLMDRCQKDLAPLKSFVLPGGGRVSALLHVARTVCRRAERDVLRLMRHEDIGAWPLAYLNRLSDLLFVLSRWIGHHLGEREFLWERPLQREAQLRAQRKP